MDPLRGNAVRSPRGDTTPQHTTPQRTTPQHTTHNTTTHYTKHTQHHNTTTQQPHNTQYATPQHATPQDTTSLHHKTQHHKTQHHNIPHHNTQLVTSHTHAKSNNKPDLHIIDIPTKIIITQGNKTERIQHNGHSKDGLSAIFIKYL